MHLQRHPENLRVLVLHHAVITYTAEQMEAFARLAAASTEEAESTLESLGEMGHK